MDNASVMTDIQSIVIDLFGEYEPIEKTQIKVEHDVIVTTDIDGYQSYHTVTYDVPHTEYLFNWNWAVGVVMFVIVLYSFLRCVGGVLRWKT